MRITVRKGLAAIEGKSDVFVSMDVAVLERLQTLIARALDAQTKELPPE